MYFKQFYLGCLAHASYMIGSDGEAAVVDPQRDVELYLAEAERRGFRIKYVVQTHLHGGFVSGYRELAARTGAHVVFGRRARAAFPHLPLADGDELRVGQVVLHFLETPGRTPEGIAVLVIDTASPEAPPKVLTGDTLVVGDVGRPDLATARGYTPEQMAGMLYDSLHVKMLALPDQTEVYPAHGVVSACGRHASKGPSSTVGEQRRSNYALRPMPREEFVKLMAADLSEVPAVGELPRPAELPPQVVAKLARKGYVILDVRTATEFGAGHVPGALNVGLGGRLASCAAELLPVGAPIVLVADGAAGVEEAVARLARAGIVTVKGFLGGGMYAWVRAGLETATVAQIPAGELDACLTEGLQIVDVRRTGEPDADHLPGALNAELAKLDELIARLDPQRPTAVTCASGYRSSAAASVLAARGFREVYNVVGGAAAWAHPDCAAGAAAAR
jgi:rhodanese-related sulfurtransferase/glyoxylase-like metal-dependent hydrolase (beta-lactamase superfamily II)